ncbi:Cytochrome protein, partial [Ophiophagus hannah]
IIFSNGHIRKYGITSLRKLGLRKKSTEHQIEGVAQTLGEIFRQTKGQPLDPSLPVINAVSNVICALSFGHQFAPEDENFQKCFFVLPRLMSCLPGPHKEALASIEVITSFAKQEIEKYKESSALNDPQGFIDYYLLQME